MFTSSSSSAASVDVKAFLSTVTPALASRKPGEALATVLKHWTVPQLIGLLEDKNADVRKVAALALGLAGDTQAIKALAVALHDKDAMVHQMAEHAMWLVWFRCGKKDASCMLKRGSEAMNEGALDEAVGVLTKAIEADPDCAEAYNQRAIAHYLAERFEESVKDCKATLERMPQHFGAMAGLGHCYAHLGRAAEARKAYRLALAINPRMEGVADTLEHLEEVMKGYGAGGA